MNKTLYRPCTVEELFNIVPPPVALPTPVQVSPISESALIAPVILEATGDVVGTPASSFFKRNETFLYVAFVVVGISAVVIYNNRQQKKRRY